MIPKRLEAIAFEDLEALVNNGVSEGRTLDFKRALPGTSKDDAREFLADVTSLANTNGGDLVFGVDEQQGRAMALLGLEPFDPDKDVLRLEQMLSASVDPRIGGVGFRSVEAADGRHFLVARVPASMAAPHRVTHTGHDKFYARNSRGKYLMDTHELRLAFTATEGLPARLRSFHDAARQRAQGEEFPLRMTREGPYVVLSVVPLSALRQAASVPVDRASAVMPARMSGGVNFYRTLDGILAACTPLEDGGVHAWSLLHEAGRLDAAWLVGWRNTPLGKDQRLVFPIHFEPGLVDQVEAAKSRLKQAGIEGPWAVFLTIEGIQNYHLVVSHYDRTGPSWHKNGSLPELISDDLSNEALLDLAKRFWLVFGVERPDLPFPYSG